MSKTVTRKVGPEPRLEVRRRRNDVIERERNGHDDEEAQKEGRKCTDPTRGPGSPGRSVKSNVSKLHDVTRKLIV